MVKLNIFPFFTCNHYEIQERRDVLCDRISRNLYNEKAYVVVEGRKPLVMMIICQ